MKTHSGFIVGLTLCLFLFSGCDKENEVVYNVIESVQDEGGGSNGNGGTPEPPPRYYFWKCFNKYDAEEGQCYVAMKCEGPFPSQWWPSCSEPGRITFVLDENGARIPTECNTPIHPFPDVDPNREWDIEFTKEHIEEIWDILQSMYDLEILTESPEDLWNMAPNR